MERKRGKEQYSRDEVWKVLQEIQADLKVRCEDNEVMRETIDEYFENFEL